MGKGGNPIINLVESPPRLLFGSCIWWSAADNPEKGIVGCGVSMLGAGAEDGGLLSLNRHCKRFLLNYR